MMDRNMSFMASSPAGARGMNSSKVLFQSINRGREDDEGNDQDSIIKTSVGIKMDTFGSGEKDKSQAKDQEMWVSFTTFVWALHYTNPIFTVYLAMLQMINFNGTFYKASFNQAFTSI